MTISYLACPYSHPDPAVRENRYTAVTRVAFELMKKGIFVYSPITHNIPIDRLGIHGDWLVWRDFDHTMLSRCDRLLVLKLDGWEKSKGLAAEISHAQQLGIPIEWLEV